MPTAPAPTALTCPEVLGLLRHDGHALVGLPVGSRPSSLRAATVEPMGFEVCEPVTIELMLSGMLVPERTRDERARFVHVDPLPVDAARIPIGDGLAGPPPEIAADEVPPLDAEPVRLWAGIVEVTPELAAEWLERNVGNRPLSRATVRRYAALMAEGRWMLGTDAIGFSTRAELVNGQHRLTAVVQHGGPVWFAVATGLDPAVFAVLDAGRARSAADALAIEGFEYSTAAAALVRNVMLAEAGKLWIGGFQGGGSPEIADVVRRAVGDREAIQEDAREASLLNSAALSTGRVLTTSHAAVVLHAARLTGGRDGAVGYLERVGSGLGIVSREDPAFVVRQALLDDQRADVPMGTHEKLAILVRGALAAAAGRPMKRARGKGAGAWPSPPVPGWPKQSPRGGALKAGGTTGTIDDPEVAGPDDDDQ